MRFDSTQSDQFDPSRTHKPHELDDERLIQDGFSKLPEPTPPAETQDEPSKDQQAKRLLDKEMRLHNIGVDERNGR